MDTKVYHPFRYIVPLNTFVNPESAHFWLDSPFKVVLYVVESQNEVILNKLKNLFVFKGTIYRNGW